VRDEKVKLGQFLRLDRVTERMECARERPGGPKEFSPGRQPWVQEALRSVGAPTGRKNKASEAGTLPDSAAPCGA
jgi:hypothetical protein